MLATHSRANRVVPLGFHRTEISPPRLAVACFAVCSALDYTTGIHGILHCAAVTIRRQFRRDSLERSFSGDHGPSAGEMFMFSLCCDRYCDTSGPASQSEISRRVSAERSPRDVSGWVIGFRTTDVDGGLASHRRFQATSDAVPRGVCRRLRVWGTPRSTRARTRRQTKG